MGRLGVCNISSSLISLLSTASSKRECIPNSNNTRRSATASRLLLVAGTDIDGTKEGRGLSIDPAERNRRESGGTFFALGDSVVDETWVRLVMR